MRNNLYWFVVGMVLWLGAGAILGGWGAMVIGYTWVLRVVGYGTLTGAIAGFVFGTVGWLLSSMTQSTSIMAWMIIGSVVGAIAGFSGVILVGDYPKNDQGNLGFLLFGPLGVAIGALIGIVAGIIAWRLRQ